VVSSRLDNIKGRWSRERKVSANDVEWLLDMAAAAEKMKSADELRRGRGRGDLGDLFDGLFGR
jgi:hypothetical protein